MPSRLRHRSRRRSFRGRSQRSCRLLESDAALTERELLHQLLIAILALYSAGLALPEVDPELDSREEPFFDQNTRQMRREQLAEGFGSDVADPER